MFKVKTTRKVSSYILNNTFVIDVTFTEKNKFSSLKTC